MTGIAAEEVREMHAIYITGATLKEVGAEYGRAKQNVHALFKKWGLPTRGRPEGAAICAVTGCDEPTQGRNKGMCRSHYMQLWRRGEIVTCSECARPPVPHGTRCRNHYTPTYHAVHVKMQRDKGSASNHQCAMCAAQAADWAFDGDPDAALYDDSREGIARVYSLDQSDYIPLCKSCHRTKDNGDTCKRGHVYTPANTRVRRRGDTTYRSCRMCQGMWS